MFKKVKVWIYEHRKELGLVITGVIVVGGIVVAIVRNNGKIDEIPVDSLEKEIVPDVLESDLLKELENITQGNILTTDECPETVAPDEDAVRESFERNGYIRKLHEGWNPSPQKLAQAAEMGIELHKGETLVDPCTVNKRVA